LIYLVIPIYMADPLHAVRRLSTSDPPMGDSSTTQRRQKFVECLTADNIDIAGLRKLAWSGIPDELRPISWQLLLVCRLYIPYNNLPRPWFIFLSIGIPSALCLDTHLDPCSQAPRIRLARRAHLRTRKGRPRPANMAPD